MITWPWHAARQSSSAKTESYAENASVMSQPLTAIPSAGSGKLLAAARGALHAPARRRHRPRHNNTNIAASGRARGQPLAAFAVRPRLVTRSLPRHGRICSLNFIPGVRTCDRAPSGWALASLLAASEPERGGAKPHRGQSGIRPAAVPIRGAIRAIRRDASGPSRGRAGRGRTSRLATVG